MRVWQCFQSLQWTQTGRGHAALGRNRSGRGLRGPQRAARTASFWPEIATPRAHGPPKRAAIRNQETYTGVAVFLIPAMDPHRKGTCGVGP